MEPISKLSKPEEQKSRLRIVFDSFALLGGVTTWFFGSVVPLLVAGGLFCICAFEWRTEAQRQKYRSGWIALALCVFVASAAVAIYLKR